MDEATRKLLEELIERIKRALAAPDAKPPEAEHGR